MATEVSNEDRDVQPYSNIGLIWVTFPDGTQSRGTCSLIGQNDILTATHMVYSPDNGGWANEFTFYFGADYNDLTGRFEDGGFEYTPSQWHLTAWPDQAFTDDDNETMLFSEIQYDTALIGVSDAIGDTLGWLGVSSGYNSSPLRAEAVGYPVDATGMMQESVSVDKNLYYEIYNSDNEVMGPGSSGGPLLVHDRVIGVKSTGYAWSDIGFVYDALIAEMEDNNSLLDGSDDDYADNVSTPGVVPIGGQITGEIEQSGDADWFAVSLLAGQAYQIDLEGESTSEGSLSDPYLNGIYFSEGKSGTSLIAATNNDDGGDGLNSRILFTPNTTGSYFVSVSAYHDDTGTYSLSITENHDQIVKGTAANDELSGGIGNDRLAGYAGNDILDGGSGSDYIDGGNGIDTALFHSNRNFFVINKESESIHVSISGTTDSLVNIERLSFADMSIAYDLDGNAGKVASLLGAVFGADAVANKEYVGIGLELLDTGTTYEDLADIAISVAGLSNNETLVQTLWENLFDYFPTAAEQAPFVAWLEDGSMTPGELTIFASDIEINQQNINLIGLVDVGLEYIPVG